MHHCGESMPSDVSELTAVGLIDTEAWRVNLRDYKPVARFGASFYTRTEDRFSLSDKAGEAPSVNTAIDQM